jgi:hypothetical protein
MSQSRALRFVVDVDVDAGWRAEAPLPDMVKQSMRR